MCADLGGCDFENVGFDDREFTHARKRERPPGALARDGLG
jgi:hypothetical protein